MDLGVGRGREVKFVMPRVVGGALGGSSFVLLRGKPEADRTDRVGSTAAGSPGMGATARPETRLSGAHPDPTPDRSANGRRGRARPWGDIVSLGLGEGHARCGCFGRGRSGWRCQSGRTPTGRKPAIEAAELWIQDALQRQSRCLLQPGCSTHQAGVAVHASSVLCSPTMPPRTFAHTRGGPMGGCPYTRPMYISLPWHAALA